MRTTQLLSLSLLLSVAGCTGGQTGEIAPPFCELPLGVTDVDTVADEVGFSARQRLDALESPWTATLTWDDGTSTDIEVDVEAADERSTQVQILGGDDCDPYLRVAAWLIVRTGDGRLNERLEATADLQADRKAVVRGEAFLSNLGGTFDPLTFVRRADPAQGRLLVQVNADGATSEGLVHLNPGIDDGEVGFIGTWETGEREVAAPFCELPLGVVDIDTVAERVGAAARQRFDSLGSPWTASLDWEDGMGASIEVDIETAEDRSSDVQILGGDDCEPYLRAPAWLLVRTGDGRLNERLEAVVDLYASRRAMVRGEAYLSNLAGTFDPLTFVDRADPSQGRLMVQVNASGARTEGLVHLNPGIDDGEVGFIGTW